MRNKMKIAVFVSGNGSNLQAIIDACKDPSYPVEIACVISNKPQAFGLTRAKDAGIPTHVLEPKDYEDRLSFEKAIHETLQPYNLELLCLAGFLWLLGGWFIDQWPNKIINLHPSLLPSFKGLRAPKQAVEKGVKIAGCTVHYVVEEMDEGAILAQATVPVFPDDTGDTLAARITKEAEHPTLVRVIKAIAEDKIFWKENLAYIAE